jgi:hypothetical protein
MPLQSFSTPPPNKRLVFSACFVSRYVSPLLLVANPFACSSPNLIMQKVGENWSSNTVTSRFTLKLTDVRLDGVYSEPCGFGWRFEARRDGETLTFQFDPHLLSNTEFNMSSVTVRRVDGNGQSIGRPQSLECGIPSDSLNTESPFVEFTVSLPSRLGLSLPSANSSSSIKTVLKESLLSGQSIDTLFLFSRIESGQPYRPRSLFASVSALKGRSSYLDACKSFGHPSTPNAYLT